MNRITSYLISISALAALLILSFGISSYCHADDSLELVWADEFDGIGLPDTAKWSYDVGDGCPKICGWGNNELQYYADGSLHNTRMDSGYLVIEAHQQAMGQRRYTSGKLVSKRKGDWKYGRMEVRAKLPAGRGVWPAIWMLPTDKAYGSWPASGEIDIMEHVGYMPDSIFSTVHTKPFNHIINTQTTRGIYDKTLNSSFHVYRMDWNADRMDFYFDGIKYQSFQNLNEGPETWPFDQRFYMVLNLAVGGNWGGKMGVDTSIWPQRMLVDYVRVYQ